MVVRCCIYSAASSTSACSSPRATPCGCPRSHAAAAASTQAAPLEPVVSGVPSPSRPPPRGAAKPRARCPRTGNPEMIGTALQEMVTAPLLPPEEGRVVNPLFPFLSVLPLAQQPAVPKFSIKEQFLSSLGPKRARVVSRVESSSKTSPLSCTPCLTVEPGKGYTAHSDPATGRLPRRAPRATSLHSTSLPHCGYAYSPLGPICAVSASLVSAPQSVSLAHSDHQARLCDSVRPASPRVQRCPLQ